MAIRYLSGINVDSNTLFVDDANNRVGIGTGSPTYKFEVSNGTITGTMNPNSSGFMFIGSTTNHPLYFGVYDATRMMISTSGNVGIGTTSPSYTLQVGSTSVNSSAAIIGNATAGIEVRTNSAGGRIAALEQYFGNEGSLWLYLSNAVKILLRADGDSYFNGGNVGIGTTSPAEKLHVAGNIRGAALQVYDGLGAGVTGVGAASSGGALRLYSNGAVGLTLNTTGAVQLNDYGTGANTGTATYGLAVDSSGNIIEVTSTIDGSGTANYVTKWQDANTLTNSVIYDNGTNVGIGTTSPGAPLHVNVSGASDVIRFTRDAGVNGGLNLDFTGANANLASEQGGYTFTTSSVSSAAVITAAGNVGIGTTSPANKLEVSVLGYGFRHYGDASNYLRTYVGSSYQILDNGTNQFGYFNGKFYVQTGGTDKLTIDTSGNVGIGTTSPVTFGARNLDVNAGSGAAAYIVARANSNAGTIELAFDTDAGYLSTKSNHPLIVRTNDAERMRITSAGDVGIGTTNPNGNKLQVNGRIYTVGTAGQANAIFQGGQLEFYKDATPTYAASIGLSGPSSGSTNDIVFETYGGSWSERMRITAGGNVLIGTTTDAGYKLDVSGTGRFSGDLLVTSAGSTTITNSGTNPIFDFIRTNNGTTPTAQINFKTSQGTVRWQVGTNQAIGAGFEINEGDATANRFYLAPGGAATFSSSVTATQGFLTGVGGILARTGATTSAVYGYFLNTSGGLYFGAEGSAGGVVITGNPAYYAALSGVSGLSLSADNGNTVHLKIVSTGAATFSSSVTASSLIKSGGTSAQYLMADGSVSTLTNPVTGTGTTNYVPKWTGASALGDSLMVSNSTGIGIGISNPTNRLYVQGQDSNNLYDNIIGVFRGAGTSTSNTAEVYIQNDAYDTLVLGSIGSNYSGSSWAGARYIYAATGDLMIKTLDPSTNLRFYTAGAANERMRITSGGNVLIGTTTDNGDKFQVVGNTTINGSLYLRGGSRYIVGDGGDLYIDTENVAGRDLLLQTQSGQNVGIGATNPISKLQVNGQFRQLYSRAFIRNRW